MPTEPTASPLAKVGIRLRRKRRTGKDGDDGLMDSPDLSNLEVVRYPESADEKKAKDGESPGGVCLFLLGCRAGGRHE